MLTFKLTISTAECIYKRKYLPPGHKAPGISGKSLSRPTSSTGSDGDTTAVAGSGTTEARAATNILSAEDDAKLVFGTVFSLRNIVRKLGGVDDKYV